MTALLVFVYMSVAISAWKQRTCLVENTEIVACRGRSFCLTASNVCLNKPKAVRMCGVRNCQSHHFIYTFNTN